jgi:hypothetical protein
MTSRPPIREIRGTRLAAGYVSAFNFETKYSWWRVLGCGPTRLRLRGLYTLIEVRLPDYPDIDGHVLIKSLEATARDANETPERSASAAATAQKIMQAVKLDKRASRKPQ